MDPVDGPSLGIALSVTGILFALVVVGLPGEVTTVIGILSGLGLLFAGRAWWLAVTMRRP